MLAEGDLHGVQELDDHEDQEHAVEQIHDALRRGSGQNAPSQADRDVDEKRGGARGEERSQADVDDVLDARESPRDRQAQRLGLAGGRGTRHGCHLPS